MKVKDLLTRENWIKGCYAKNLHGEPISPESQHACKWCLVGALQRCYPANKSEYETIVPKIQDYLKLKGFESFILPISSWNDKFETTFEDVIKLANDLDI